jgi:hypothetical protein
MKRKNILVIAIVLMILASLRLVINIPNFSPIGAIALMGGALLTRNSLGLLITFGVLILSDILLAYSLPMYSEYLFSPTMFAVYFSFGIVFLFGKLMAGNINMTKVMAYSLLSAVMFFLITNASSWMVYDFYPKNFNGLLLSYEAGLPFFRNTLVSQILFSSLIFAIHKLSVKVNSTELVNQ